MTERLDNRTLNHALLARQMLLAREHVSVAEATARVVGLQAQHPASAYIALWNRIAGFSGADLDTAYADGTLVRAMPLRMTLHTVRSEDYPTLREANEPTLRSRFGDIRFTSTGLTVSDVDALLPDLLAFASEPRTPADYQAWLAARTGVDHAGVWWAVRQYAPWLRAVEDQPWRFIDRSRYVAPNVLPRLGHADVSHESLQHLVRRYLAGYGPASIADMAIFMLIYRGPIRRAVEAIEDELVQLAGPKGEVLYDLPGAPLPSHDIQAPPRLLGMWDNALLAHQDRSRIVPPNYRAYVQRRNGDLLPTLLVDGYVAGVWRAVEGGIEATAFHLLSDEAWEALAVEARSLLALISDRDPLVYSRYGHWWNKLPAGDTRVLPS